MRPQSRADSRAAGNEGTKVLVQGLDAAGVLLAGWDEVETGWLLGCHLSFAVNPNSVFQRAPEKLQ